MKYILALLATASTLCYASTDAPQDQSYTPPYISAKTGYFFFTSSTMNDVYTNNGLDLQLSSGYPIINFLRIYGSVEYCKRSGHSLGGNQKTSIWQLPLSLGLQPVVQICKSTPIFTYLSLGPRYVFAHVNNDSNFVSRTMNSNGFGGFINAGFQFIPIKHFLIDLFGEYSYTKLNFSSSVANSTGNNTQVGGFTFGGGIGYAF